MSDMSLSDQTLKRAAQAAAKVVRDKALDELSNWVRFLENSPNNVLFPMSAADVQEMIEAFKHGQKIDVINKAREIYAGDEV